MRALVVFLLWAILLVLCWPLALVLLILWPILWLLSIPFRIVGSLMEGILALVKAIFLLPARLLGRQVLRVADEGAIGGQGLIRGDRGQREAVELDPITVGRERDALRAQAAVDHAALMDRMAPLCHLGRDAAGPRGRQGALVEQGGERRTGERLHDQVAALVGELAEVADLGDVRVTDAVEDARLAQEALVLGGVGGAEDLEPHRLAEVPVTAEIGRAVGVRGHQPVHAVAVIDEGADEGLGEGHHETLARGFAMMPRWCEREAGHSSLGV